MPAIFRTLRFGLLLPVTTIVLSFLVVTAVSGLQSLNNDPARLINASADQPPAVIEQPAEMDEQAAAARQRLFRFLMQRRSPIKPAIYIEPVVPDGYEVVRWDI
jgi:hypothetical protein